MRAIANELNPVSGFILRATCQWPHRYGMARRDAYQDASGDCPHPQAFYGVRSCQRNMSICSIIIRRARTAECPHCPAVIPLSPNWRLDSTGTGIRVTPIADTPAMADVSTGTGTDTDVAIDFDIAIDAAAQASGIALTIGHDRTACRDCRTAGGGHSGRCAGFAAGCGRGGLHCL